MSKKNNLLYLDDEDSNLIPFKAFFRKKYEVYTANNGEDAFKVLENHNIHIIIKIFINVIYLIKSM